MEEDTWEVFIVIVVRIVVDTKGKTMITTKSFIQTGAEGATTHLDITYMAKKGI